MRQIWAVARDLGDAEGAAAVRDQLVSLEHERAVIRERLHQLRQESAELLRRVQEAEDTLAREDKHVRELLLGEQSGEVLKSNTDY